MPEVRLIDANAAADKIMREVEAHADEIGVGGVALMIGFARALRDETDFPTIEAKPMRHGRWKGWTTPRWNGKYDDNGDPEYIDYTYYTCSMCYRKSVVQELYCPACGAKMDSRTPTEVQLDEADSVMGGADNG